MERGQQPLAGGEVGVKEGAVRDRPWYDWRNEEVEMWSFVPFTIPFGMISAASKNTEAMRAMGMDVADLFREILHDTP